MNPSLFSQFEILRAHVEASVKRPSVIMITSALAMDGKSLTAHGLAERLADSGHRVLLVDFRSITAPVAPHDDTIEKPRSFPILSFPIDDEGSTVSTPALRAKIDELRSKYDYTVIDSESLLESRVATLLVGMVDGIFVTVRLGRRCGSQDEALVQTLQRSDSKLFGAIVVASEDIDAFSRSSRSHHPDDTLRISLPQPAEFPSRDRAIITAFEGLRR